MFPNKSAWLIAKQAFEKKKNKNNEQQSGWELECRCIPNDVDQISEYGCNDSSVFISTTTEVSNDQIPIGDCDVRRSKGDGQWTLNTSAISAKCQENLNYSSMSAEQTIEYGTNFAKWPATHNEPTNCLNAMMWWDPETIQFDEHTYGAYAIIVAFTSLNASKLWSSAGTTTECRCCQFSCSIFKY